MRLRFYLGSLASVLLAFIACVWAHEFTHILQAWYVEGVFKYDMCLNPTFREDLCEGHLAYSGRRDAESWHGFWLGESVAYVVTYSSFVLVFCAVLPRLAGVVPKRRKIEPVPADIGEWWNPL